MLFADDFYNYNIGVKKTKSRSTA